MGRGGRIETHHGYYAHPLHIPETLQIKFHLVEMISYHTYFNYMIKNNHSYYHSALNLLSAIGWFVVYCISLKSRCGEILFQGPVWCGDNSRAASAEIDKHMGLTISIAAHLYERVLHMCICI